VQRDLEVVLGEAIRQGQIALEPRGGDLAVVFWSNLVFRENDTVSPRIEPYLKAVGDHAARQPGVSIAVEAHASGPDAAPVSMVQARNVADFLLRQSQLGSLPESVGRGAETGGRDRVEILLRQP